VAAVRNETFGVRWHCLQPNVGLTTTLPGVPNPKSPLPTTGQVPLYNTVPLQGPAKWHLIPSNGFSRVHKRDRRTDGQTMLQ